MEYGKIEHWKLIYNIDGIYGDRYGIYPDGTVVNLEIPLVLTPYKKRGVMVVDLHGFKKTVTMPIMKLVALFYLPKSEDDCIRLRSEVIKKDENGPMHVSNLKWVSKYEKRVIKELRDIPEITGKEITTKDYVIPICRLLARGYDPDEVCYTLDFSNRLFVCNIMNRRIYKDISKKYKW